MKMVYEAAATSPFRARSIQVKLSPMTEFPAAFDMTSPLLFPPSMSESSPMVAVTLCAARRVSGWSHGAERLLGWDEAAITGRPLAALVAPAKNAGVERALMQLESGESVAPFSSEIVTREGDILRVEVAVAAIRDAGRFAGTLLILRDTEARGRGECALVDAQERAAKRALVAETANRVALDILSSRSGIEALRHIAEAARVLAGARYAALGVARREGAGLQEFIAVGMSPDQEAQMGSLPGGQGILGLLLESETPLRIENIREHPRSVGFPAGHPPMRSFLGVPIRRGDQILGSLYLTEKEGGGAFTEADEVAVGSLGAHAAVAVHNLHMLARQRALVSGFVRAQEDERRAIAYDLHDGLTQYVMASQAHFEAFRHARKNGATDKAERALETGTRYLQEAVVESRRLVNGLRLLALEDLGLAGALEQLLREEETRAGWDVELSCNIAQRRFESELEIGVYRVAQEALTNVRKHAGAARVTVKLWAHDEANPPELRLEVRDWGQGFASDAAADTSHVGLHGMSERVGVLGGTFHVASVAGKGTTVRAVFPIGEIAS